MGKAANNQMGYDPEIRHVVWPVIKQTPPSYLLHDNIAESI